LRLQRRLTGPRRRGEFVRQPSGCIARRGWQALEWAAANPDELNALERQFLEASEALAERETAEREAQRQRELEAARKLAETEKAHAETAKRRAEEQTLSANRLRQRNRVIAGAGAIALVLAVLAGLFGLQSNQNATRAEQNLSAAQIANTQVAEQRNVALDAKATAEAERAGPTSSDRGPRRTGDRRGGTPAGGERSPPRCLARTRHSRRQQFGK
jgi:hypothetical protein